MSLSTIGSPVCVAGTTVTLPTHAVGDIIEICAYVNGSNGAATKPSAGGTVPTWVAVHSAGGANTNSLVVYQAVATATNHTSGTWTGATHMGAIVRRGQHATTPIGGEAQGGGKDGDGVTHGFARSSAAQMPARAARRQKSHTDHADRAGGQLRRKIG